MTRRAAGFTLIETVVALALAGLVGLLLFQGLRMTAAGTEAVTRHADRLDARLSFEALLDRALAAAVRTPGFVGKPDRLSFVAAADDGAAGLYRIELGLSRHDLVLTRRLAVPFAEPRRQRSVVAEAVRRFSLSYFGAAGPADPPSWHDTWENMAAPPLLVRIELDTADGEPRPPLVVRLWSAG